MDAASGRGDRRGESGKAPERKGSSSPRQRGEPGALTGGGTSRPPQEPRRKRNTEQRYAGFGDGIERAFCARSAHFLPAAFPVESHAGAATIPRTIVARRADAVLLCTFSHCDEHVWPDGEVVADPPGEAYP